MAEYIEVMRQKQRMCRWYAKHTDGCPDCPLSVRQNGQQKTCMEYSELYAVEAEAIIMAWVAKHPDTSYPTWQEWWELNFPNTAHRRSPCPRYFMTEERIQPICDKVNCQECASRRIPADIAAKLGIEPVEE